MSDHQVCGGERPVLSPRTELPVAFLSSDDRSMKAALAVVSGFGVGSWVPFCWCEYTWGALSEMVRQGSLAGKETVKSKGQG